MTGVKNIPKSLVKMFPPLVVPPGENFRQVLKLFIKKKKKKGKKMAFKRPYHVLKLSSVQRGKRSLCRRRQSVKKEPGPKVVTVLLAAGRGR